MSVPVPPRVLLVNDFLPSDQGAGALLLKRLLAGLPAETVRVVVSSNGRIPLPPTPYEYAVLPILDPNGRWGWGRLKNLANHLKLPALEDGVAREAARHGSDVIVAVAHGPMMLAAAAAARRLKKPLVLIVHDDWVYLNYRSSFLPSRRFYSSLYRRVLRQAARVYAVSGGMAESLRKNYGVEASTQYPSVEVRENPPGAFNTARPRFLFMGLYSPEVADCMDLLVRALKTSGQPSDWTLELYCGLHGNAEKAVRGWGDDRVKLHAWASQEELPAILGAADVLVLPHSFRESARRFVGTSFPTKASDYMNAGRPILVIAPPYSALNRHAKECGFAEIVEEATVGAVQRGVRNLLSSPEYREKKIERCRRALREHHDIRRQREEFAECLRKLARGEALSEGGS